MTKSFILILSLFLTFSSLGQADNCKIKMGSVSLQRELGSSDLPKALREAIEQNPQIKELLKDPDFLQYLAGVLENKSLTELRPTLNTLWASGKVDGQNLYTVLQRKILAAVKNADENESAEFKKLVREVAGPTPKARFTFHLKRIIDQIKALPKSLRLAKKLVNEDLNPNYMDARVFDAYGYLNLKLNSSRMRPWEIPPGALTNIKLSEVKDIDPTTFIKIAMLASEIEAPINNYSDNSGETFRVVSPQMSRFMGKTSEEAEAHKSSKASYCTNSWCYEESRHEGVLKGVSQRIAGWNLDSVAPFDAYEGLDPLNPKDALFHLYARNSTEWNAMSGYFILGTHSEPNGAAATWFRNVRLDEIKHMSVFLGFFKYLHGNRPHFRFIQVLKKAIAEVGEKGSESEYGDIMKTEPIAGIEMVYISVLVEKNVRAYLSSLPFKTLKKIYETEVKLDPLPAVPMDPEKAKRLDVALEEEKNNRLNLARWNKKEREETLALNEAEVRLEAKINDLILNRFNKFSGAEDFGSEKDREYQDKIQFLRVSGISNADLKLVKKSLRDTLRDYQIMNNQTVRKLGLKVEYKNAREGFDIVKDETFEKLPKVSGN